MSIFVGVQWPYSTPGLGEYFITTQIPSVGHWGRNVNCKYSRNLIIILRCIKDQEQTSQKLLQVTGARVDNQLGSVT